MCDLRGGVHGRTLRALLLGGMLSGLPGAAAMTKAQYGAIAAIAGAICAADTIGANAGYPFFRLGLWHRKTFQRDA